MRFTYITSIKISIIILDSAVKVYCIGKQWAPKNYSSRIQEEPDHEYVIGVQDSYGTDLYGLYVQYVPYKATHEQYTRTQWQQKIIFKMEVIKDSNGYG